MTAPEMTPEESAREQGYEDGGRAVWLHLLWEVLRHLGYTKKDHPFEFWASEREETVMVLRRLCEAYGDNDWGPTLHLADVLDKHLGNRLELLQRRVDQHEKA